MPAEMEEEGAPKRERARWRVLNNCETVTNLGHIFILSGISFLVLAGTLINQNPSPRETVSLGKDLDCLDGRPFLNLPLDDLMRKNESRSVHQALIVAASVILPATPLLLNSMSFNEGKWNALVAHVLGQSASFGSTEIARHFLVAPNRQFFPSCNLSLPECQQLPLGNYRLAQYDGGDNANATNTTQAPPRTSALCQKPAAVIKDLFDNLHSMPDVYSALIGSSAVIFASNLWFWKHSNTLSQNVASSHAFTKIALIGVFLVYVTMSMFYRFKYVENAFGELVLSFLYGAGIQFFISVLYQNK
jgi:hypothetical protein